MTNYRITRYDASIVDCRVFEDDKIPYQLPHIPVHSPTGFNAGYLGSGPADLALALLAHHFGEDPEAVLLGWQCQQGSSTQSRASGLGKLVSESKAVKLHQRFKQDIVGNIFLGDNESYTLNDEQIGHWVNEVL
jgi:hypothetical protein